MKKCPRCRLANPEGALRCDCGYDFSTQKVETAYFKQKLPKDIKIYFGVLIVANVFGLVLALASGKIPNIILAALWTIAIYILYGQLLKKRDWARIALIVITFPLGIVLGLSREARLYCLQKDES